MASADKIITRINKLLGQLTKATKASKASKASGPMTTSAMMCRHVSNGKRCRRRSKGPRFKFMCEDHVKGKRPTSTKAKPKVKARPKVAKKAQAKAEPAKTKTEKAKKPKKKKKAANGVPATAASETPATDDTAASA